MTVVWNSVCLYVCVCVCVRVCVTQVKKEWDVPTTAQGPCGEYELSYPDGGEVTTGELPCKPKNLPRVTHINLWNNDVSRIEGLEKYPNLLRLTLKSNDLTSLKGIEVAKYVAPSLLRRRSVGKATCRVLHLSGTFAGWTQHPMTSQACRA